MHACTRPIWICVSNKDYIVFNLNGEDDFKTGFENDVVHELRVAFDPHLSLAVVSWTEAMELHPEVDSVDYVYISLITLVCLIVLFGLSALIFNYGWCSPRCGCSAVDDGRWLSVVGFSLQVWDFFSDLALSAEIWRNERVWQHLPLLFSGIGSSLFVVLPYFSNLLYAARIKSRIQSNEKAKSWFESNSTVFVVFVVVTGGCYPALALISSNVFGHDMFSSGLTQFELRSFSRIKVVNTVFLENVPQLCVQMLYVYAVGSVTDSVAAAFVASLLSAMGAVLSYFIQADTAHLLPVQYRLELRCDRHDKPDRDPLQLDDGHVAELEAQLETLPHLKMSAASAVATQSEYAMKISAADARTAESAKGNTATKLTKDERLNIQRKRGLTWALRKVMSGMYEIEPRMLEVGSSMITNDGVVTDFVQFVSKTNLERMEQEMETGLTPLAYFERMLASVESDVTLALRSHFGLNDEFHVALYGGLRRKSAVAQHADVADERTARCTMTSALNRYFFDDPNTTKTYEQRRSEVLQLVERFNTEKRKRPPTKQSEDSLAKKSVGTLHEIELGSILRHVVSKDDGSSSDDDDDGKVLTSGALISREELRMTDEDVDGMDDSDAGEDTGAAEQHNAKTHGNENGDDGAVKASETNIVCADDMELQNSTAL